MRWMPLLFVLGCASYPEESTSELPFEASAVPAAFRARVAQQAIAGRNITLQATGVAPGTRVTFAWSNSFGSTCPPALRGACLDLAPGGAVLATAIANAAGTATASVRATPALAGRWFAMQAWASAPPNDPAPISNGFALWVAPVGSPAGVGVDLDGDGRTFAQGDCHDGDVNVFPGAVDAVGDGLDQSCDGLDGFDADADRIASVPSGGTDCDDTNAAIRPDAEEVCDGIDANCDGIADADFPDGDGSGTPDCREVVVLNTWGFLSHDLTFWTCDNLLPVAREMQAITETFAGIGLGVVRVDEHEVNGVSAAALAPYAMIVVNQGGWGDPLRAATVDALLATADRPTLFLGDDIGLMADRTSADVNRPELYALTHIQTYLHNGNLAFKGLGAEVVSPDHPTITGPMGDVGNFAYAGDFDHVDLAGQGETVLLTKEQVGTPVAWVAEEASRRVAVIMPSLNNNNNCPVSDPDGLDDIATLVQNTALWLLE